MFRDIEVFYFWAKISRNFARLWFFKQKKVPSLKGPKGLVPRHRHWRAISRKDPREDVGVDVSVVEFRLNTFITVAARSFGHIEPRCLVELPAQPTTTKQNAPTNLWQVVRRQHRQVTYSRTKTITSAYGRCYVYPDRLALDVYRCHISRVCDA